MTYVIEFPTLFALIDPSGTAMTLEEFVYTRKCERYYSWEMLRLQDFLDAHDRLPEADYKACSLSGFKDVIAQALAVGCKHGFCTISARKGIVDHSISLLVRFETRQVELFDSRGCDLMHPGQQQCRRGFYTKHAVESLHLQIMASLFPPCGLFTLLKMDQRYPCLQQGDSTCRRGALLYLFYRLKYPTAARTRLYRQVKNSARLERLVQL